jgi:hypothetical protein
MPDREIDGFAGVAVTHESAKDERFLSLAPEALGYAPPSYLGGQPPDGFDPPDHGYYRSRGYRVVPYLTEVSAWRRSIRSQEASSEPPWPENERLDGPVPMAACRLLAGPLPGSIVGYASHLVLDLGTPRRLPPLG